MVVRRRRLVNSRRRLQLPKEQIEWPPNHIINLWRYWACFGLRTSAISRRLEKLAKPPAVWDLYVDAANRRR